MGSRIFGSTLVVLSVVVLSADKITNFKFDYNFGFLDTSTFIWTLSQSFSPLLLIISFLFNPYKISYLIPVYFYSIQLYWAFDPTIPFDNYLLQVYAIGVVIFIILLGITISNVNQLKNKKQKDTEKVLSELKRTINILKKEILS